MKHKLKFPNFDAELYVFEQESIISNCKIEPTKKGYVICHTVKNDGDKILCLNGLKYKISGLSFGENCADDYFYANENARLFNNLTIPVDYDRLNDDNENNDKFSLSVSRKWCDPEVKDGEICSSPYQPFPAILLSNYKSKIGLVCGSLSQECFCHTYTTAHEDGSLTLNVNSCFKSVPYRELLPNETLTDEFFIGQTDTADDINGIFNCYTEQLRKVLSDNFGSKETNRHTLIWDSWNDGIYRDVSEEMLVEEAKAVKELFPTVEWFQLDDGYSSYCEENVDLDAHGLGVPYEGELGIDYKKFPNGLKGYTDKIKEIGLKPAIWVGGFCPVKSKIYKEHPEWFIDYTYRVDWTAPLDVSIEQVREYMKGAIAKFFEEYGFVGLKHDFWSYAFEDRHNLLFSKSKSGYEYRKWWQKHIRECVKDGYVETGCDVSMGNPFIGKYFNNYRLGLDIGAGKWENVKTTMFWALSALSTQTGDLFVPNSDSIGLLPGLTDEDFLFAVNFQIITRTLVEISGRFSKVNKDDKRLKIVQRATNYLNNGENVYFAKYDYRQKGMNIPEIIYINSAFDAPDDKFITIALFNSDEVDKKIEFNFSDVGLPNELHQVEFVWEEKTQELNALSFELKPHGSLLLKVKKNK